jgi:predicted AAA+ superfamily ATPase
VDVPLDFSTRLSQASGLFRRFPDLPALVAERSFFLLGPRQTGKSTLSRASFPDALFLDLLDAQTCRSMVVAPNLIGERA